MGAECRTDRDSGFTYLRTSDSTTYESLDTQSFDPDASNGLRRRRFVFQVALGKQKTLTTAFHQLPLSHGLHVRPKERRSIPKRAPQPLRSVQSPGLEGRGLGLEGLGCGIQGFGASGFRMA